MSAHNSPTFWLGYEHGERDEALINQCPPAEPVGPEPPFPDHPVMYMRGYMTTYHGNAHQCTGKCAPRIGVMGR